MIFKFIRILFVRSTYLLGFIAILPSLSTLAQTTNASASIVQSATVWETYTVRGEEFSVQLPVLPAMSTSDNFIVKLNKYRQERILGAYADGVVYAIYTYQNLTHLQSLDDLMVEFQIEPGAFKRELTLNSVRGKEYDFQNGELSGVNQFYFTRDHLYVFKAIGSSLGQRDVGIPKFLASIQLGQIPQGKQVLDGPGMQPNGVVSGAGTDGGIFKSRDLTAKARVITKPAPSYTEQARRDQLTGTIVIKCVFSSSGAVTDIVAVYKLPDGLTEKAVAAAQQIRFIPAVKDGRFVSMYMQLEYNFNLY